MAGYEDQSKPVVGDGFGRDLTKGRVVQVIEGSNALQFASDLVVLGRQSPLAAEGVDGLALPYRGEPGPGVLRRAVAWPLAERVDQGVLGEILGQADVAGEGGQRRDHPGELDPVDGLDRGGGIGGRHPTDSTTASGLRPEVRRLVRPGRAGPVPRPRPGRPESAWTTRWPRARSRHSIRAQPPTSSLASAKGPSTTVYSPCLKADLAPLRRGSYAAGGDDDVPHQVQPEPEPVVPSAPATPEQPSAVEAFQRHENFRTADCGCIRPRGGSDSEGERSAFRWGYRARGASRRTDTGRCGGTDRNGTTSYHAPPPLLKPNAIAREVPVRATGISPEKSEPGRQLFNEETTSVLVAETSGVILLSAAVTAGQLLVLTNVETKREVIVQILRKRSYKPTMCYLEVEFVEAAPRFWGTEFSAATALLPKNTKDVETVALVITAEATADQPWVLPTAPDTSELQMFKREMEGLRGKPALTETPTTNAEATALAQLRGEVYPASAIPETSDALSTEAILESGLQAAAAVAPTKRAADPARQEAAEQAETPQTVSDFINSLPKSKRWRLPRGGSTPEFNRAVLMLAIVLVGLVVGTAWFKNWLPWKSAGARLKKPAAYDNMRVASDVPTTSAGKPAQSAPVPDAGGPAPADGSTAPVEGASSDAPVEPLAPKKKAARATAAAKAPSVRPAAKPAANSEANSGKDSVVVPPKLIQSVQAVASLEAMRDFERGNVVIDAVVGTSGEVHFISVISGPPSLRAPAVESLKEYKYEPATRNGQPVPAHVTITIHFRFEP